MPSALEKLLAQSGTQAAPPAADPASDLVLAAMSLADELQVLLAWDPDNDGDDDSSAKGDTDHDYWSKDGKQKKTVKGKKPGGDSGSKGGDDNDSDDDDDETAAMVKKLVAKGVPLARAKAMAARAAKNVKAAALAEGILVALSGLSVEPGATLAGVRGRMAAAARAWQPGALSLTHVPADEHEVRLAVLSTAERKKSSAHTIPGTTDFPIPDKGHLSAAVARYKEGALAGHPAKVVAAHIRSRAKALGEQVDI